MLSILENAKKDDINIMKLRKFLYLIVAAVIISGTACSLDAYSATKKKETTTQSSSKKGKSDKEEKKSKKDNDSKKDDKNKKEDKDSKKDDKNSKKDDKNRKDDKNSKDDKNKKEDKDSKEVKRSVKDKKIADDKNSREDNKRKNNRNSKDDRNSKDNRDSKDNKNSRKDKDSKNDSNSSRSKSDNKQTSSKSDSKQTNNNSGWKKRESTTASKASTSKGTAVGDSLTTVINNAIVSSIPKNVNPGGLQVNQVKQNDASRSFGVQLNENFTYMPVNRDLINGMEKTVKKVLPDSLSGYSVNFTVGDQAYSSYITHLDKLADKDRKNTPVVMAANPYVHPTKGMEGDIVAMWHSHGRYYKNGSWAWQRPFLFSTAEDIYTMSYVLPFLTPMLENAGAYVFLPRERDLNDVELIIDNDRNPYGEVYSDTTYMEMEGSKKWETGKLDGFIYDIPNFRDTENPFQNGTYRQVETIKSGKPSQAGWYADIPKDGEYAIYVSYKSLPNSSEDARYIVNYSGGSREFIVNQKMGGGTWIYLGTFPLQAGYDDELPVVMLTNRTEKGGNTVVTADAVKIGGGMGNIERSPRRSDVKWEAEELIVASSESKANTGEEDEDEGETQNEEEDLDDEGTPITAPATPAATAPSKSSKTSKSAPKFSTSGLPRFLEGARYWLHWAGFPESVYSGYNGNDDYKDDYSSRGKWVNYLAGGSRVLPNRTGLGIPVDISFALHTDAGKRSDDTFVGTLGIYYTKGGISYADGTPRNNSRILTDLIMRQVVGDIRQEYEPRWTRRSMWDKAYAEAHTAEVPSTLLELLSHQNFADMQYGLDPTFRFTVSRAIYKAMGRFISNRKGREFIVQPLPVKGFMITNSKPGIYTLSWQPTDDPLEPTAKPTKYIVMERSEGDLGFKKIGETKSTVFDVKVKDKDIHSFYIIAANDGGLSFPSEILACREGTGKPVMIVNGFTRVSAPMSFSSGGKAGFKGEEDFGVPYKYDISFGGYQTEFSRSAGEGFGRSNSNHVTTVVGGNTFDYPAVHGEAIAASGRGFVSCSLLAVEEGKVNLSNYSTVDLILGKQKLVDVGGSTGKRKNQFPAFSSELQNKLSQYVEKGGKLIVSGQNIVSDLFSPKAPAGSEDFAAKTLGLSNTSATNKGGKVKGEFLRGVNGQTVNYSSTLNRDNYIVEHVEVLEPAAGVPADVFLTFPDSGQAAGIIVDRGKGTVAVMSVPFETILDKKLASTLMKELLIEMEQ